MKQRETLASINGIDQKIVYRAIRTETGVVYEGLLGKLPFSFSTKEDGLIFSDSLQDVALRKAIISAVFNAEDSQAEAGGRGR